MSEELKSLKQYAKEAKKRLKSGFWDTYRENLQKEIQDAKQSGVPENKVREYFQYNVISRTLNAEPEDEQAFYARVKQLLDEEGEVSNAIGRLTEKTYFESLDYEERQRYTLSLSERYLKALDRYKKEKEMQY